MHERALGSSFVLLRMGRGGKVKINLFRFELLEAIITFIFGGKIITNGKQLFEKQTMTQLHR